VAATTSHRRSPAAARKSTLLRKAPSVHDTRVSSRRQPVESAGAGAGSGIGRRSGNRTRYCSAFRT